MLKSVMTQEELKAVGGYRYLSNGEATLNLYRGSRIVNLLDSRGRFQVLKTGMKIKGAQDDNRISRCSESCILLRPSCCSA